MLSLFDFLLNSAATKQSLNKLLVQMDQIPSHRRAPPLLTANIITPSAIFVLGGPGVGKGTQCKLLSRKFGLTHLSAGELLRAEMQRPESKYGAVLHKAMLDGTIVPAHITTSLLRTEIFQHCNNLYKNYSQSLDYSRSYFPSTPKLFDNLNHLIARAYPQLTRFLIDGFPRNESNWQEWQREFNISKLDIVDVAAVLVYETNHHDILKQRLQQRTRDNLTNSISHENLGNTSSVRADDNIETIQKRFATFERETIPVIASLEKMTGFPVFKIDASTSASEIHSLTQSLLSSAPLLTKDRQCREDMLHKLCDLSGTGDGLSLEEQFMKIHLEHVLRI